jgi:predicted component of type VI protein secretion system
MEARNLHSTERLVLETTGAAHCVALDAGAEFLIGRLNECHLIIDESLVSRVHARILCDRQYFVLMDESTNGTFVRHEDETVTRLHRGQVRLWGSGHLSFGAPLSPATAVRFQYLDRLSR